VPSVASAATLRPISFEEVAPALPSFDSGSVLRADLVEPVLARLEARGARGSGLALARQWQPAGRLADLAALSDNQGDPLSVAVLRGIGLYASGRTEAAAGQLRGALRIASDFFPAVFYLGACYAAGGKHLEAAGAWRTSLIGGGGGAVYRLIVEALLRGRDAEQALEVLLDPEASWPDSEARQRALGLAYLLAGRRAEALAALSAHVDRHPDDLPVLYLSTRLLFDDYVAQPALFAERERLLRYARAYRDSGGEHQAVVGRWLAFVEAQ
jgi:tetratricopeptide (TPR) repeat protein